MNDEQTTQQTSLDTAGAKLFEDLQLTNIPDEQKQALIARIETLVEQEVLIQVMSRLSDDDITALEAKLGDGEQPLSDEAYNFIKEKVPGLDKVVEDAVASVYDRIKTTNDVLAS